VHLIEVRTMHCIAATQSVHLLEHSPPLSWISAGVLPSSRDVTLVRGKHAPIEPYCQGIAMNETRHRINVLLVTALLGFTHQGYADDGGKARDESPPDGSVSKTVLHADQAGENVLKPTAWRALEEGYRREGSVFTCDNGANARARRGVKQRVVLNQQRAQPIVASAWSKAEGVTGTIDADYALYLDFVFVDGTELWGQVAGFRTGTHDWQREEVFLFPEKPIKSVDINLLLRAHAGKALFREPVLRPLSSQSSSALFDGVPVVTRGPAAEGFQVRDVAAGSDFVRIAREAVGLRLDVSQTQQEGATFFDVSVRDTTGKDRAVTLLYAIPVPPAGVRWLDDPRRSSAVEAGREYVHAASFRAGANGRLSTYPLGPWHGQVTRAAWHWRSTWPSRPSTGSATTPAPESSGSPMTSV